MPGLRLNLKAILNAWAPPHSRRRRLLWKTKFIAMNWMRPMTVIRQIRYGNVPSRIDNVYDIDLLQRYLYRAGVKGFQWNDGDPARSPLSAARWILHQLLTHPEVRRNSDTPLRDGIEGDFGKWLCSRIAKQSQALDHVRQVFANPPGVRIRSMFNEYYDWRLQFPLALTPDGRGQFLHYLLAGAMPFWKLPIEEVLWFHLDNAEDPMRGIAETYQLNPEWQQLHPLALTPDGWPRFKNWFQQQYDIQEPWLDQMPTPPAPPAPQLKLLRRLDSLQHSQVPGDRPFGINVMGHFRYPSGLQEATLNAVAALELADVPHAKRDVPNNHMVDLPDRTGYLDLETYDVTLSTVAAVPLAENRYRHAGLWKRDGVYRIACWYWELETVLPAWAKEAQHFQEMWAPTKFIRDAFQKHLSIPVTHMPAGIRFPNPTGLTRTELGLPEEPFLFLFMFDMASVFQRKNPLAVVESFKRAVGRSRDVRLVIKLSRGDFDPANLKRLQDACAEVDAVLLNRVMTRNESYGLLENCDCYISLHRSEGYGLTMAEAMSYGKPVIATGYSANLDFTTPENARLVSHELVPLERDYTPYPKGAFWADPSVEDAAKHIRWVLDHPVERDAMAARGQREVREGLSLQAYGRRMRERLKEILETR